MNVFITGGTGLIGSAVVAELLGNGHTVVALARSDSSAAAAESAGAVRLRGGLADLDVLREGAGRADGVIHLAFANDFSSPEALARAVAEESAALAAIGEALVGSERPFVTCSGTPVAAGRPSTEEDPLPMDGPVGGRSRASWACSTSPRVACAAPPCACRAPSTTTATAGSPGCSRSSPADSGVSGYPGDGAQRWPAVHALDVAVLFRLALEQAPAGTAWHGVADEGDAVRDIAAVIGRRLGLPVQSVPTESYGPLGVIFAADQPASSAHTRAALGWEPTHPSLLDDLENIQASPV